MAENKGRKRYYKSNSDEDDFITLIDGFDTDAGSVLAITKMEKETGLTFVEIQYDEFRAIYEIMVEKQGNPTIITEYNRKSMGIENA